MHGISFDYAPEFRRDNNIVTRGNSVKILLHELIEVSYDQYSYLWLNLVAEVGGYVGLFLGFSVFHVTALVDMLLQRNWVESFKSILNKLKTSKDEKSLPGDKKIWKKNWIIFPKNWKNISKKTNKNHEIFFPIFRNFWLIFFLS